MTMPASARMLTVRWAMAGVGIGPHSIARPPVAHTPLAMACSSMYPERRVSFPMRTRGTWLFPRPATNETARPSWSATSGVMGCSLATPRIPSVPKSFRAGVVFTRSVSEVHELEIDPDVVLPQDLDGGLQVVLVLAAHAHLALLDGGLHLELGVLDDLHDCARLLDVDPVLDLHDEARELSGSLWLAGLGEAKGHLSFDELVLQDDKGRLCPVLAAGADRDGVFCFLEGGLGVLEVESLGDFFVGLVEGVVDLVPLNLRDDVEVGHGETKDCRRSGASFKERPADRAAAPRASRALRQRGPWIR